MAAPKRNRGGDPDVRTKIQTTQLVKRLQDNALGNVEMTQAQIQSAKILLDKTLPNLANVTLGGDPDKPVKHVVEHTFKSSI